MTGYNRVIMVGNLTRDPELKQLNSGQSLCKFAIASSRQFRNKQSGEMQQEVCYVDIDVWGPQAEPSSKYLQKGRPVLIEGRLKLDTWENQEGQKRSKHSIVADKVQFLGTNASDDQSTQDSSGYSGASYSGNDSSQSSEQSGDGQGIAFKDEQPFEDDLPF